MYADNEKLRNFKIVARGGIGLHKVYYCSLYQMVAKNVTYIMTNAAYYVVA